MGEESRTRTRDVNNRLEIRLIYNTVNRDAFDSQMSRSVQFECHGEYSETSFRKRAFAGGMTKEIKTRELRTRDSRILVNGKRESIQLGIVIIEIRSRRAL